MLHVLVSADGRVLDPDTPLVHADDLGVLHGDGLFETLLIRDGRACGVDRHLARLTAGTGRAGLPAVDPSHVARLLAIAVEQWGARGEGMARVIYTRGREGTAEPTLYVTVSAVAPRVATARRDGVRVVTLPTAYRSGLAAQAPWLLTGVKSLSYAANVAALRWAQSSGADDAIFLAEDQLVLEGPRSSVVAVIDGALVTPMRDDGVLPGTTQEALFEVAAARGIPVREQRLHLADLRGADAIWLTSSITLAARVRELDGAECLERSVIDVADLVEASTRS